jgi:hypothetical protein
VQTGDFVCVCVGGDDNPYHIVGIGSIQIRTHDSITHTHTLTALKHIPTMNKILVPFILTGTNRLMVTDF